MIVLADVVIAPGDNYGLLYPPLGLASLASALRTAGYPAQIELFFPEDTPDAWVGRVLSLSPSVVGFSVFMGHKLAKALMLSRLLKERAPQVRILWGGVHPSLQPKQTLAEPAVDWVCIGDGEDMIVALAHALMEHSGLEQVRSLAWRRDNTEVVCNPPGLPRRPGTGFRVDWESFPVEKFIYKDVSGQRIMGFISSRGCPRRCGFCYTKAYSGQHWEPLPLERVQQEMLWLRARHGIDGFLFLDDLFFGNHERAMTLLQWMASNNLHCHSVDIRIDQISGESLQALRDTGCRHLFIGIESINDRILALIQKGYDVKTIDNAVRALNEFPDVLVLASLIVGFPTESFAEMQQTIARAAALGERPNTVINLNAFMPFPNTELHELSLRHGFREITSLDGWARWAEARGNSLNHFPGRLTRRQGRHIQRAAQYLYMLFRPYPLQARSPLKRCVIGAFQQLAQFRLRHGLSDFPADMWLYYLLRSL